MSHRKVYSQGSIPFSWEDKPGISKVTNQECLKHNSSLQGLDLKPPSLPPPPNYLLSNKVEAANYEMTKIPLPPCPSQQTPRRSTSSKEFKWKDDPFLVAYKECTKTVNINGKLSSTCTTHIDHDGVKKGCVVGSKLRKTKFMFSCKSSCDTREDNFIKLSNLPPLPRHKIQGLW